MSASCLLGPVYCQSLWGRLLRRSSSPLGLRAQAGDGARLPMPHGAPRLVWGKRCSEEMLWEGTGDLHLKGGGGRGCHSLSTGIKQDALHCVGQHLTQGTGTRGKDSVKNTHSIFNWKRLTGHLLQTVRVPSSSLFPSSLPFLCVPP